MLFMLFWLLLSLAAGILGIIGIVRHNGRTQTLSIIGLVLGVPGLLFAVFSIVGAIISLMFL